MARKTKADLRPDPDKYVALRHGLAKKPNLLYFVDKETLVYSEGRALNAVRLRVGKKCLLHGEEYIRVTDRGGKAIRLMCIDQGGRVVCTPWPECRLPA